MEKAFIVALAAILVLGVIATQMLLWNFTDSWLFPAIHAAIFIVSQDSLCPAPPPLTGACAPTAVSVLDLGNPDQGRAVGGLPLHRQVHHGQPPQGTEPVSERSAASRTAPP